MFIKFIIFVLLKFIYTNRMIIAIPSSGNKAEALIDERFARCPFFCLYNTDTRKIDFKENTKRDASGGVGPQVVEFLATNGVNEVLSVEVGPKAQDALNKFKISTQIVNAGQSVQQLINLFMKQIIAIPTSNNCLCQHFGHCEKFAIFQAEDGKITGESYLVPPPHEPGVLPAWLASKGVNYVIAGGMGQRAISLFNQHNITVLTGAEDKPARALADEFLKNELQTGVNACDH